MNKTIIIFFLYSIYFCVIYDPVNIRITFLNNNDNFLKKSLVLFKFII
jgi:hypothetical protein